MRTLILYLSLFHGLFATSISITSFVGDELTFDDPTDFGTPTGLNSLTSFSVQDSSNNTATYSADNFFALAPTGITSRFGLQFQGTDPQSQLFSDRESYLTSGQNGLSLSTGINLRSRDPVENWQFQRIFLDNTKVGDGIPDFIAADLAQGQSADRWTLRDAMGVALASIVVEQNDWNLLGEQDLAQVDFNNGTARDFVGRELWGLALELSDFEKEDGSGFLSSADASLLDDIAFLTLDVPGDGTGPRTDYGFIASNTDTIAFIQQVPEPSLGLLTSLGLLSLLAQRKRA